MTTRSVAGSATVVITFCASVAAGGASPQETLRESSLDLGSRIRLSAPAVTKDRVEGTLLEADERSLSIGGGGRPLVVVPRESITRLEVSTSRRGQTLAGALIGGGIGAGLGYAFPCFAMVGCTRSNAGRLALLYGVGGAFWGGVVGTLIRTEQWRPVPVEAIRVSPAASAGGGVGLSVSIRF